MAAVKAFFELSDSSTEKYHKLLCLGCWGLGGVIYFWNLLETFWWTATYPSPNLLAGSAWMMNMALRLFTMWMPMSFLLLKWKMKTVSYVLYLVGGSVAIILGVVSVLMMIPYLIDDNRLDSNFFSLIVPSFKEGSYPLSLKMALALDGCCAWHGPADFVSADFIPLVAKQVNTNGPFMEAIASCTGESFAIQKNQNGNLVYSPSNPSNVPEGCKAAHIARARRIFGISVAMALVISIISPVLMVLHHKLYKKFGGEVRVTPSSTQMQNAQSEGEVELDPIFSEAHSTGSN